MPQAPTCLKDPELRPQRFMRPGRRQTAEVLTTMVAFDDTRWPDLSLHMAGRVSLTLLWHMTAPLRAKEGSMDPSALVRLSLGPRARCRELLGK